MTTRERNMLIVLGVVAVVALAFFFLVLGGEEEQQAAPTPPTSSPAPIPATPGTGVGEPAEQPGEEPPRAVTFFGGRDPFVPLVEEEVAPTDGETPPADGETPPSDGETPPSDGETTPPSDGDGDVTDGDGIAVTGRPVVLVDVVDEQSASVQVDGVPFTVTEGQRFARLYRIVSVEANCARFLYGDESFSLCEELPPA